MEILNERIRGLLSSYRSVDYNISCDNISAASIFLDGSNSFLGIEMRGVQDVSTNDKLIEALMVYENEINSSLGKPVRDKIEGFIHLSGDYDPTSQSVSIAYPESTDGNIDLSENERQDVLLLVISDSNTMAFFEKMRDEINICVEAHNLDITPPSTSKNNGGAIGSSRVR